jgi:hypothetical protein
MNSRDYERIHNTAEASSTPSVIRVLFFEHRADERFVDHQVVQVAPRFAGPTPAGRGLWSLRLLARYYSRILVADLW